MTMDLGPTEDRETNIQWNHDEDTAHIYTCDERMITRLKKSPLAVLVETHKDQEGRITGMEFDLPVWAVSIRSARRVQSERQREAFMSRMKEWRHRDGETIPA